MGLSSYLALHFRVIRQLHVCDGDKNNKMNDHTHTETKEGSPSVQMTDDQRLQITAKEKTTWRQRRLLQLFHSSHVFTIISSSFFREHCWALACICFHFFPVSISLSFPISLVLKFQAGFLNDRWVDSLLEHRAHTTALALWHHCTRSAVCCSLSQFGPAGFGPAHFANTRWQLCRRWKNTTAAVVCVCPLDWCHLSVSVYIADNCLFLTSQCDIYLFHLLLETYRSLQFLFQINNRHSTFLHCDLFILGQSNLHVISFSLFAFFTFLLFFITGTILFFFSELFYLFCLSTCDLSISWWSTLQQMATVHLWRLLQMDPSFLSSFVSFFSFILWSIFLFFSS